MQQEQKKVVSIKFIRVAWNEAPQRGVWRVKGSKHEGLQYIKDMCEPPLDSLQEMRQRGLDIAHSELEDEVEDWLKDGWIMEGGVTYINPDKVAQSGLSHLVQKMVMYEETEKLALGIRR